MTTRSSDDAPTLAYSYVRFSTREQAGGDSLRRQTEATAAWCERHGIMLDSSTTFRDLGKSAYLGTHRKNADRHALAAFLKLVEAGRIPKGSYLIIENLDRLSREEERPALRLWMDLLDAGINIVQLNPETIFRHEKSDMFDIMRAVMELSRGHGESSIKSARISAAWAQKKKAAREDGQVFTRRLPAWVEERGDKLRLIPERAKVVRTIFALSAAGYGNMSIVKRLTADKVPCFGDSGQWLRSYVQAILADRRAVGELQPRLRKDGKPDGKPVQGYFPAVVTEDEYNIARDRAGQRKKKQGRLGKHVNVFSGLLRNARDGDTYFSAPRRGGRLVLINTGSFEGRAPCWSFPLDIFEQAILGKLREVSWREVLGQDAGPDEVGALAGELAGVEAKITEIEVELLQGDVAALARVLRQLEERKADLAGRLAQARQKAASPLSEAWAETHSLLDALAGAADQADARLRLRGAIRRVVESVWLLVVPSGRDRAAAVQVWFEGGARRDYLIFCRSAGNHRPGGWGAKKVRWESQDGTPLDLRLRDRAAATETLLMKKMWPGADDGDGGGPAVLDQAPAAPLANGRGRRRK